MALTDYLRVLRERWKIVALAMCIGLMVSLAAYILRPPVYTAQLSLFVSSQVGTDADQAFQGAQLSEQRVKSYNELVTSQRVMAETVGRLGLQESPEQLATQVTAASSVDSVIINVAVEAEDARQAATIVNTVGIVVSELVSELERPTTPDVQAPIAVRIVQPAAVPTTPSSIGLIELSLLGLLVGAALGLAGAVVRDRSDRSIKSVEQLADIVQAPNLGTVPFNQQTASRPILTRDDPQSGYAESFRQLRTNLQFIDVDNPRRVIMITSARPAEGKSTTVANLAIVLASTDVRLLVIEADMRRPKLSAMLGLDSSVGLSNVLSGRLALAKSVQPWNGGEFHVLSAGAAPPNPSELLASNQMRELLAEAKRSYDLILLDTPPLLPVTDAAALAPATDGAVVVARFKQTTSQQITAAAKTLRTVQVDPLGTILTMVPEKRSDSYQGYSTLNREQTPSSQPTTAGPSSPTRTASVDAARTDLLREADSDMQLRKSRYNQETARLRPSPPHRGD